MNPEQQGGQLPPQNQNPQPAPQQPAGPIPPDQNPNPTPPQQPVQPLVPPTPVVTIPGQGQQVVTPVVPVDPANQPKVEGTPYDFILHPQQPAKKPLPLPLATGSKTMRIAIFGGGIAVLIIVAAVLFSILGKNGGSFQPVIAVAEEQTELVRVATQGVDHATDQKTQNLANNVLLGVGSAKNETLNYLKTNKQKVDSKVLALKHSKETDTSLANAQSAGTFDTTFIGILQNDLSSYSHSLQAAYKANPGPKGKALLSKQFNAAQLLLTQSKQ